MKNIKIYAFTLSCLALGAFAFRGAGGAEASPSPLSGPAETLSSDPTVFSGTVSVSAVNAALGGDNFTFVHLADLHIGEGAEGGDYGTPGVDDTAPAGDVGAPAQRLRETVNWINANKDSKNIEFVMVTGDLTDSGEKSEFHKAKEILDALTIPYVPLIGNHDIWPYTADTEAKAPVGDEYFKTIFAPTFDSLKTRLPGWDDGTRLIRAYNKENGEYAYFQNFSFTYKGYNFICADFNTRTHAPVGKKGVGPTGELYNFKGGTWPWFTSHYNSYPGKGTANMLVFEHHPLVLIRMYSQWFSLSIKDYKTVTGFLNDKKNKPSVGAWISGHLHRNAEYAVKLYKKEDAPAVSPGIETGAVKEGNLRLVTVWGASK